MMSDKQRTYNIICSCKREGRVSQPVANEKWVAESDGWVYRSTASFDEQGERIPIGWYCGRNGHWQERAVPAPASAASPRRTGDGGETDKGE